MSSVTSTIATMSYDKITSVLSRAVSDASSISSVLATASTTSTMQELQASFALNEATASYYSYLEILATATATEVINSVAPQAASASSVMHEVYKENAFYNGNKPSVPGNITFCAFFIILTILHLIFGSMTKQWWLMSTWLIGCIMEACGYMGRVINHFNMFAVDPYLMQLICLMIAPSFFLAGIYYLLAQITVIMGTKFSKLKPIQYSILFIILDVISIIIQALGGAAAAGSQSGSDDAKKGSNIMVAGLVVQVISITIFQYFWYDFLYKCYKEEKYNHGRDFNQLYIHVRAKASFIYLIHIISISVLFLYIRSIYRVIELVKGFSSKLATTEAYFIVFEALMTSLACLLLTIIYPGWVFGRNTRIIVKKGIHFSKKKHASTTENKDEGLFDSSSDLGLVQAPRTVV